MKPIRTIDDGHSGTQALPSDRLLELTLNAIGEGVHGLDRDGRIAFVNTAAERMLGWRAEDLIGKPQHATIHHSTVDGRPAPADSCEILATIRDGRVHHGDREVFWRRDGTSFPVDYIATPLRDGGAIIGAVVAFRDISERLELAREQAGRAVAEGVSMELQRVLLQVPAAMAITRGPQHRFEAVNALYRRLIGGREIEGKTIREAFPEIAPDNPLLQVRDRVYATGQPSVEKEVRATWRDQSGDEPRDGYLNIIHQPLRDADDNVFGIMTHAIDVTEMVQARESMEAKTDELARMAESVSRINRELDQFAYIASHDLKAPLRGIASLAHWLEEDLSEKLGPESRQHLDLLQGRTRRLEALIDGILKYSRAGRVRDKIEHVDVGTLLDESIEMLAPPREASIIVMPGMPTIETERSPLQQVFMNLIANALRHAGRKDVAIRVGVEDDGDFHRFSVADNGQGIAAQFHDKIWEIFQTLEPRDRVEGTGIGLALVKKNVTNRGGRVWLESREGEGAAFSFLWPKRAEKEAD